jgi:hypothetical protein
MTTLTDQKTTHHFMTTAKPIGGFFELELPIKGSLYHDAALALANGRVCFKAILERVKPTKVFLPFFCPESLISPLIQLNIAFEFYGLTPQLDPKGIPLMNDNELFLYINYFGLKSKTVQRIAQSLGEHAVIDNSQAFFEQSFGKTWSFNSARKFFGVPDGGFLYSPQYIEDKYTLNKPRFNDHLWLRLLGEYDEATQSFLQNETHQTLDLKGMSRLTRQILYAVDYSNVARIRKKLYRHLDRFLRPKNGLSADILDLEVNAVPYCYPFLPKKTVSKEDLEHNDILLADNWSEILGRDTEGYAFEKNLSEKLLLLPIDHRLDIQDAQRIIDTVQYLAQI